MQPHSRYRAEDGFHCVDIRLANVEQLFDNRDPAPFRDRDLDPDLVEYLLAAAEDLRGHGPFRIVLWLPAAKPTNDIPHAMCAHFDYELERIERGRRRQRRTGQVSLLIGVVLLGVLLSAAHLIGRVLDGGAGDVIREGLTILSWVALWRPVDTLIYDWLPVRRTRALMRAVRDAPIDVRASS